MTFAEDVLKGLTSNPKFLPSKYFYDERGDQLFQKIMELDEYYLTDCEFEILDKNKARFLEIFNHSENGFQLIEFGAGDGYKTKILLQHFLEKKANFKYVPIDISQNVLDILSEDLKTNLPDLNVEGLNEDYFKALKKLNLEGTTKKVVLFLGSNIGNFTKKQAKEFLTKLSFNLSDGDLLLIGFDLKKDPDILFSAYNDPKGITSAFNLNLLERINRELGGNFDIDSFKHFPRYDPVSGEMESFLLSSKKQEVFIEALQANIQFDQWEPIHMEISRKYDPGQIEKLAEASGFRQAHYFFDSKQYFVNTIWELG